MGEPRVGQRQTGHRDIGGRIRQPLARSPYDAALRCRMSQDVSIRSKDARRDRPHHHWVRAIKLVAAPRYQLYMVRAPDVCINSSRIRDANSRQRARATSKAPLRGRLDRHKAHVSPCYRFTDGFGIVHVILVRLHVRLHKVRRHQLHRMSHRCQLATKRRRATTAVASSDGYSGSPSILQGNFLI